MSRFAQSEVMTVSNKPAFARYCTHSMGLKLTTPDPENFGLLILKVADGTAGSLLAFLEHRLMSFSLTLQCSL